MALRQWPRPFYLFTRIATMFLLDPGEIGEEIDVAYWIPFEQEGEDVEQHCPSGGLFRERSKCS
jgi:hypothetical protein